MWSKLLTLSGVLLFVAACETAPDGSADGSGQGGGEVRQRGRKHSNSKQPVLTDKVDELNVVPGACASTKTNSGTGATKTGSH